MSNRRKPYPHVMICGDAAREILSLAGAWDVTPEDVVRRLVDQARIGRGTAAAVKAGAALFDYLTTPAKAPGLPTAEEPSTSTDIIVAAARNIR